MDQNNNFNSQPWNKQPDIQQPQPKSKRWMIWVGLGVIVIGLMGLLLYKVIKVGQQFGKNFGSVVENSFEKLDSISNKTNDDEYKNFYSSLGNDSVSERLRANTDILKHKSDSICEMIDGYLKGFQDTIGEKNSMSFLDRSISISYFIKTGRALALKRTLHNYTLSTFNMLPPSKRDSSLLFNLFMIEDTKFNSSLLKEFANWENVHFKQPPTNVKMSLRSMKTEVRTYERAVLFKWESIAEYERPSPSDTVSH